MELSGGESSHHGDQMRRDDVIVSPEAEIVIVGVEVACGRRCFFTMNVLGMAASCE